MVDATNTRNWSDDQLVGVHDAVVPPSIRAAVLEYLSPGDTLWRCPRVTRQGGFLGFGQHKVAIIEWWLIGADGELIEAFSEMHR